MNILLEPAVLNTQGREKSVWYREGLLYLNAYWSKSNQIKGKWKTVRYSGGSLHPVFDIAGVHYILCSIYLSLTVFLILWGHPVNISHASKKWLILLYWRVNDCSHNPIFKFVKKGSNGRSQIRLHAPNFPLQDPYIGYPRWYCLPIVKQFFCVLFRWSSLYLAVLIVLTNVWFVFRCAKCRKRTSQVSWQLELYKHLISNFDIWAFKGRLIK